ncbi:winged helix-turn-helix domain-containing protein [Rhizomonospora bruguierae]|uniref:winged helix-turn-helix domain-containing protein n=1 Tax=Rhizomonospora bruguierae TaxID=1581705 RepID=UPI0020BF08D9|nr:winged helix-turn-helix domain-containing protein [Micromonospora sp. NBRC 107566]
MLESTLPLVVCVSTDPDLRERVVRQLDGRGAVLLCADLAELRAALGTPPPPPPPSDPDAAGLGDLAVDPAAHAVTWRGARLPLTRIERDLLARLASRPVGVWTYQRLFDAVWGGSYLGDSSILHSAVKRLRRKLRAIGADAESLPAGSATGGPTPAIETVRGVGYRLTTRS